MQCLCCMKMKIFFGGKQVGSSVAEFFRCMTLAVVIAWDMLAVVLLVFLDTFI